MSYMSVIYVSTASTVHDCHTCTSGRCGRSCAPWGAYIERCSTGGGLEAIENALQRYQNAAQGELKPSKSIENQLLKGDRRPSRHAEPEICM